MKELSAIRGSEFRVRGADIHNFGGLVKDEGGHASKVLRIICWRSSVDFYYLLWSTAPSTQAKILRII